MPFITVVTATYNSRQTIEDLFLSLMEQTFGDFEWVVQDGGSNDGTAKFLSEISDPRVHVVSAPDNGIYDALNKGLRRAQGDFILFMGADDIAPNPATFEKIAIGVRSLPTKPDVVLGGAVVNGKLFTSSLGWKSLVVNTVHHQGALYSRNFFSDFMYSQKYSVVADYESTVRLHVHGHSAAHIAEVISVCGPGGISQSSSEMSLYKDMFHIRLRYMSVMKSAAYYVLGIANLLRRKVGQ